MKKLIIHIGYPKTATTSLQLNLFTRLMKENKIEYLNHLGKDNDTLGKVSVSKMLATVLVSDKEEDYKEETNHLLKISKPLTILSSESLSHVSVKSPKAFSRVGVVENAEKLKRLFSPYFDTIEIMIVIRVQKTIIPSYYTQEYFNIVNEDPDLGDIGKWINKNFGKKIAEDELLFNYSKMYSSYADSFGTDKVHVLIYEDLVENKSDYYSGLSKILDLEPNLIKSYIETAVTNKTKKSKSGELTTDEEPLISFWNRRILQYTQNNKHLNVLFLRLKKMAKYLLPQTIVNYKTNNKKVIRTLTPEEIDMIIKRFNKSNKTLFENAKLNTELMVKYGYFQDNI